jgi:hypothetical protein
MRYAFSIFNGANERIKHSTLKPTCLSEGSPKGADVSRANILRPDLDENGNPRLLHFSIPSSACSRSDQRHLDMGFETTHLTQTLPTYTWLTNHGITPSASATHTLTSLTSALKSESGVRRPSNNYVLPTYPFPQFYPALECQGHNLDSIS